MHPRLTALAIVGILLVGSCEGALAQAPRTVEQAPTPAGTLRARTQIQVQPARMPNLVGQSFQAAQQDSRVVGLKLRLVPRDRPTSDARPGVIIAQDPAANSTVRPGMTVTVLVAAAPPQRPPEPDRSNPPPVVVPRVVGLQSRDGATLLAKLTLDAQAQFTDTARVEPGTIVDQKPAPGTSVRRSSTVQILVARRPPEPPPRPDPPKPEPDRPRPQPEPERQPRPEPERTRPEPERPPDRPVVPVVVRVPLVEGLDARQGAAVVARLNLVVQAQFADVARVAPNTIVDQKPEAGTEVRPGSRVTILVARQPPIVPTPPPPRTFPMPDLVGRAFPQAERDAQVLELRLQLNEQVDTRAGGSPNTIVRQSVPAGANVQMGDAVTVFVASGVAVPRVLQQQADAASQRIVALGLNPRRSEETSELTPGVVLRQVPEPGVLVALGASVGITVAVPQKVTIPNVVGRTRADATQELARLRLRASAADDNGSLLPPDLVVSQVPEAGTAVVVGAAVRINVATGVEVPDLTGLSGDEAQRAVAGAGLSFEDLEQEAVGAPAGRVFQQQPAAGARVVRGARVQAIIALAVRPVPPPPGPPPGPQPVAPAQPVPGPVLTPPPAVQVAPPAGVPAVQDAVQPGVQPGGAQPPAQAAGGAPATPVAIPAQPLLPPWLLSLLVALVAIGVSTFRLWWPKSPSPPPIQATASTATPPPSLDVRPERGDASLRLEVAGRSLIDMDVRVRVGRGTAGQMLHVEAEPLIVDERRVYE
jgi:beta-lactam-binding protein with PASTA domain